MKVFTLSKVFISKCGMGLAAFPSAVLLSMVTKGVRLLEATSFSCKRDLAVGDPLTTFDRDHLLLLAWEVHF